MSVSRAVPRLLALGALSLLVPLTGCGFPISGALEGGRGPRDWVVVHFPAMQGGEPVVLSKDMLRTELAADRALRRSGVGSIDGNEVGRGSYDLYFVGDDRTEMWRLLRPVLDQAPVAWRRVELEDGLDDEHPTVLRASG